MKPSIPEHLPVSSVGDRSRVKREGSPFSRKRIWIVVAALLLIASGSWWLLRQAADQAVYGGRPMSFWMEQFEPSTVNPGFYPGFQLSKSGVAAAREAGSNDVQSLLRMIARPQNGITAHVVTLAENGRLPVRVRHLWARFYPTSYNPALAILLIRALGPEAGAAIPALAQMLHVPDDAPWAALALCAIGPEGVAALEEHFPTITDGIVRANILHQLGTGIPAELEQQLDEFIARLLVEDSHAAVRMSAARVLGTLTGSADVAVPALINALQTGDGGVRLMASDGLGNFGAAAGSAVDALQAALNDPHPQTRTNASRSLRTIQAAEAASVDDRP